jgi:hypothetical protein
VNWTSRDLSFASWPQILFSVAAGNGLFCALGAYADGESDLGTGACSTNGIDWSAGYGEEIFYGIGYGDGVFVLVGGPRGDGDTVPVVVRGGDGVLGYGARLPRFGTLRAVAYGNGSFVVAGDNGAIFQSDPIIRLRLTVGQGTMLSLRGPTNRLYRVDTATRLAPLADWQSRGTFSATNYPQLWADPQTTSPSGRFYRAVLLCPW